MADIEFPLTVDAITFAEDEPFREKLLFGGKCGDMVSVRPCDEKFGGKTFLGVLLGELALSQSVSWNPETRALQVGRTMHNPMIFIPEQNTVVYGCGSWWSKLRDEEQLRQITDSDIQNVWYVKALQQLQAMPRITPERYAEVRAWLLQHDPDGQRTLDWSNQIEPPSTAEQVASDIIWIILCAGRSAQAARTIEARVWEALRSGRPVIEVFGHRGKAAAIERAWREREQDFAALQQVLKTGSGDDLAAWCKALPYVGDDTQYQLAKNFGANVCKPDIWICRLAGIPDKPRRNIQYRYQACTALCRQLAEASGDRIATVDSMLWLACNKGVLSVNPQAGPITFNPVKSARQPLWVQDGEREGA